MNEPKFTCYDKPPIHAQTIKPPLGVQPRYFWIEDRLVELRRAITEYAAANLPVNEEWVKEYNKLLREMTQT